MSCDHCVQTITHALNEINGVARVQVDFGGKTVTVGFDENETDLEVISAKINSAGFEAVEG